MASTAHCGVWRGAGGEHLRLYWGVAGATAGNQSIEFKRTRIGESAWKHRRRSGNGGFCRYIRDTITPLIQRHNLPVQQFAACAAHLVKASAGGVERLGEQLFAGRGHGRAGMLCC